MKKKVDERIRTLIENGIKSRHRSMFFIVGDKFLDQIFNIHEMLGKAVVKTTPKALWCYKDKLEISSHQKKRAKQIKKLKERGLLDPDKPDALIAFSRFMEEGITFCFYKESEQILGNTFGMCILQDFEAVTPNLLARTIETVEGGGIILVLLHSLRSLTSLYTMVMDVHERFRTESHSKATGRFNERFLLSLASCKACCVIDDELNILPISSHIRSIAPIPVKEDSEGLSSEAERDLKDLKVQLSEDFPVGPLIKKCCTLDQGRAVITFLDAILDKTLRNTIALLAARGRGKSAALGLAIAGAVAAGFSNIFVTAPSPENLKTLFDFVIMGLDVLEYKPKVHYDVVKSSHSVFKPVVRINISKQHRQTIQYILPHENEKLSQAELLVVDEAAAIPLPVVKSLLGPYLVFLSSTVNGYEGTGRSLSLKLIQQLEERSRITANAEGNSVSGRLFKKIELTESIRYASGDPIESWLNGLLCLDVANHIPNISRLPPPGDCDLFYVNRDTLFSYHKDSELFLQRMMALYVASHYKNSPNDLQLMADAPAHHLFVLLGPVDESKNQLPDILCVIQVCLEGQISRKSVLKSLSEGHQPFGDQIPWKFSEQFQDTVFPTLSGARIVRIATHPSAMRLGYGSAAVGLLSRYFEGQLAPISEAEVENTEADQVRVTEAAHKASLLEEKIRPRKNLPPLLVHLQDRRPEKLHYLGVSFGLTLDLFRFWRKHKFVPFYVGQIQNTVTGEHTCMVLKPLNNDDIQDSGSDEWGFFSPFYRDFKQRFAKLLAYRFRDMEYKLAMSLVDPKINFNDDENDRSSSDGFVKHLREIITPHDLKRLEAYTNNLADYHMILDIVPTLSHLYFQEKLPVSMTYAQASILLCIGLQHRDFTYLEGQMKLERGQIMSLFMKVMNKFNKYLYNVASKEIEAAQPRIKEIVLPSATLMTSLDDDLKDGARKVQDEMKTQAAMLGLSDGVLQQYAITGGEADFEKALLGKHGKISSGSVISVKSNRRDHSENQRGNKHKHGGKRPSDSSNDHHHRSKSNKKSKH